MYKINTLLKFIFNISTLFLIILSLFPGSLLGFLFYGDLGTQPDLIDNPFGTSINHFIGYLYVSTLGFFLHYKDKNFKNLIYAMFFLSFILELFHFVVPNRSFQLEDLIGNILGVIIAYFLIKIYLFINRI
mgnify:CR=1 FL=1|tara:strand:+ start:80 stop:472 length:393 start_codon:yes stop_codon:yes gene_type:complete